MKKHYKILICSIILAAISFYLSKFITVQVQKKNSRQAISSNLELSTTLPVYGNIQESPTRELSIIAAGDILFHMPQVRSAQENGTYNFKPMFSEVKPYIESNDIAIANFETTVNPKKKYSGYPCFNTPEQSLEALKDTGFDVLLNDHNHSLDTGLEGLVSTNNYIKKYGFELLGSGEPNEDKFVILEKNGIKVAMLSYTYGTNMGIQYEDRINYIDEDKIKTDITYVKPKCDYLIVFLHIGTEYVRKVENFQQKLVNYVADLGAYAILCSHPHVARKTEMLKVGEREVLVNYSLGNFISNQNDKYTDIGSMQLIKLEKANNITRLKSTETMPVYRLRYKDNGKTIYKVVPSKDMEKFSAIVGEGTMSYIKAVSSELAFSYESPNYYTVKELK
ncbi:MAG: CapA family protein [Clostridiales bacterium]|nr:CapA family protein [Clostridiales bacterium]